MKTYFALFYIFISTTVYSQNSTLDFNEIKTNVQDSTSKYFYEKLVYRFQYDPTIMDSLEIKHLYYGKFFSVYNGKPFSKEKLDFIDKFQNDSLQETLIAGNAILRNDPTDIETLAIMLQIYSKNEDESGDFGFRAMQLKRLLQNIKDLGVFSDEEQQYTVMSIADEYVFAGFLKIDLRKYKRISKAKNDSTLDEWKSGRKKIIFRVMHNPEI